MKVYGRPSDRDAGVPDDARGEAREGRTIVQPYRLCRAEYRRIKWGIKPQCTAQERGAGVWVNLEIPFTQNRRWDVSFGGSNGLLDHCC